MLAGCWLTSPSPDADPNPAPGFDDALRAGRAPAPAAEDPERKPALLEPEAAPVGPLTRDFAARSS